LARFIAWLTKQRTEKSIPELVINGDFLDFLAEEVMDPCPDGPYWEAFTLSSHDAVRKLDRILDRADDVGTNQEGDPIEGPIAALSRFLAGGCALTILLGNHDVELSLPLVRRRLRERLEQGTPGEMEFIFNGEAYQQGRVLIEHGNRYDGWNAIDHGQLRVFLAARSRGEVGRGFDPPPGSLLVRDLMNPLKKCYRFVDLLKPETHTLGPLLGLLFPSLQRILGYLDLDNQADSLGWLPGSTPLDAGYIRSLREDGGEDASLTGLSDSALFDYLTGEADWEDTSEWNQDPYPVSRQRQAGLRFLMEVQAEEDAQWGERAGEGLVAGRNSNPTEPRCARQVSDFSSIKRWMLRKMFRLWRKDIRQEYQLEFEHPQYLQAVERLVGYGKVDVVVFGHTHQRKWISLGDSRFYLNTGTWCPTIEVPEILTDEKGSSGSKEADERNEAFQVFLGRLLANDLDGDATQDSLLRFQPTVARLFPGGETAGRGEICEVLEDGSLKRLPPPATVAKEVGRANE
jgi:UDP-2,3-diacylglucosamine pyrophosphatase LpxH